VKKEGKRQEEIVDQMYRILATDKQGFDILMKELGRMIVETIIYIEREELSGELRDML